MMIDWNEYQKQIGKTLGELKKLSPDTVRGYKTLSAANSATSEARREDTAADFAGGGGDDAMRRLHHWCTRTSRSRPEPRRKKSPRRWE